MPEPSELLYLKSKILSIISSGMPLPLSLKFKIKLFHYFECRYLQQDYKNKSFVEMGIKKFHLLVDDGFKIPTPSFKKAGGRVYDSLNTMNGWIRELIKIDGEETIEKDFKALHPNLVTLIYGGNAKYITHEKIAEVF